MREVSDDFLLNMAEVTAALVVFAIPLLLSMTLVVMEPVGSYLLFAALSLILIAANVDSLRLVWPVRETSPTLWINELIGTATVPFIVALPWVLGGIDPSREDMTWSILLAFLTGFLSVSTLVLSAYDLPRADAPD
jgi:hypothetical protein